MSAVDVKRGESLWLLVCLCWWSVMGVGKRGGCEAQFQTPTR